MVSINVIREIRHDKLVSVIGLLVKNDQPKECWATAVPSVDSFWSAGRYQKHEFADRVPVDGEITAGGAGLSSHFVG